MIYSVFDWDGGHAQPYLYLEGPGEGMGIRPRPRRDMADEGGRGHRLEDVLPEVPPSSRVVGRGDVPKGRVAILSPELRRQLGAGPPALGDDTAASAPPTGNPLVDHPWRTLGLWMAGVWVSYKLSVRAGQYVAGVRGKK